MKSKLYSGKKYVKPSENGTTYDIDMDLMKNYFEKGYVLYCDNN